MLSDRVDPAWVEAFCAVFDRCRIGANETVVVLSESFSRELNLALTELALARLGIDFFQLRLPSRAPAAGPVVRSSGASLVLDGRPAAVKALCDADLIVDLTLEGLMHSRDTFTILQSGARILTVSNEHPEALARLLPRDEDKTLARDAVDRCRAASTLRVGSAAGTDLVVDLRNAVNIGVWGWTDRPGTLAHWPAGLVVSFPRASTVNGRLVLQPGDINLTFKRYIEAEVILEIEEDFVTRIDGVGADARLMRDYYASFGDRDAYATSHVGWGLNPGARYEALAMYDQRDTNGTELRALAGNFLYSTGANEHANRFTAGHFDLPMLGCDILLDDQAVVSNGKPVG